MRIWNFRCNRASLSEVLRVFLKIKMSTSNCMLYGESGCMPISLDIEHKMEFYWLRFIPQSAREHNIKTSKCLPLFMKSCFAKWEYLSASINKLTHYLYFFLIGTKCCAV